MEEEEMIAAMLLKFLDNYDSCFPGEQDENMTTGEIFEMFQEFYPGYYDQQDLAKELAAHCEPFFDPVLRKFIWLLKTKSPIESL